MKRDKLVTFPVSFLMACLLAFGAMGCMVSGLDLPVSNPGLLYQIWAIAALAGCGLFLLRYGWAGMLIIILVGMFWLWPHYHFSKPICAMITRLSTIYGSAYGFHPLEFTGVNLAEVPSDLVLGVWGCLIALFAAGTVMQGRWLVITLTLTLLPVCSTLVVTNTPPDSVYLFMVVLAVSLLMLTGTVRRHSPRQGARLMALAAIPVGLLTALLFMLCPQASYMNRSEDYLDAIVDKFQNVALRGTGLGSENPVTPNATATSDLSSMGPRRVWSYAVMDVETDYTDVVYLRGQDYDVYDGQAWTSTLKREDVFSSGDSTQPQIIRIQARGSYKLRYIPYYPTESLILDGGRLNNDEEQRSYTYFVSHPSTPALLTTEAVDTGPGYYPAVNKYTHYLALPDSTRGWAEMYADQILNGFALTGAQRRDANTVASAIAAYVRSVAPYDTDTGRMSNDYTDFARWFLEEAETGYCVHFATASAVLLRAAGVPARYVTGYMFSATAGETVTVTSDRAHAWVEYYAETSGLWRVLESTPPDLREEETLPQPTDAPIIETEPSEEATTAPTAPTETTDETRPVQKPAEPGGDLPDAKKVGTLLGWLMLPVLAWLLIMVQYMLRRGWRNNTPNINAKALVRWQDVEIICRFTKQEPPEELEMLAQKAKFSQHTITADELRQLDVWVGTHRAQLKKMPWYVRLVCQYILALW